MTRCRIRNDSGSISIELAILLPAFLSLAMLATLLGRQTVVQTSIDLAAHDAARAASLSRNLVAAKAAATSAATSTLTSAGAPCRSITVTPVLGSSGADPFEVPVGQPSAITIKVDCVISLADLAVLGLPATRTLSSVFTSPLDVYRGRT